MIPRFIDKAPVGTFFIRFSISGKIKNSMTEWVKSKGIEKTEKCKGWIYTCGCQDFSVKKVKKDTYICPLHFFGQHGPTTENPDPILASKRKRPAQRKFTPSSKSNKTTKIDKIQTRDCSQMTLAWRDGKRVSGAVPQGVLRGALTLPPTPLPPTFLPTNVFI